MIKSILPAVLLTSTAFGQVDYFWNQQSVYNPAATGMENSISIRSTTGLGYDKILSEQLSADIRVKRLHGAVGFGISTHFLESSSFLYKRNNPYFNYAFHLSTGENSILSLGAGIGIQNARYKYNSGNVSLINTGFQSVYSNAGVYFNYKRFNIGASMALKANDEIHYKPYLETITADYTFQFNDDWSLKLAAIATASENVSYGGLGLAAHVQYKRLGFGAGFVRRGFNGFVDWNVKDNLTLGYSFTTYPQLNSSTGLSIPGHALHLKFRIP